MALILSLLIWIVGCFFIAHITVDNLVVSSLLGMVWGFIMFFIYEWLRGVLDGIES